MKTKPPWPLPEGHPVTRYLSELGPGSHRAVHHALRVLARLAGAEDENPISVAWTELDARACARLRRAVVARFGVSTANRVLVVLRGVLKRVAGTGSSGAEVRRVLKGVTRRHGSPAHGATVQPADLDALFESCRKDTSAAGCRDAAALALVYGLGLRRAVVVALDCEHYLASGQLVIPDSGSGPALAVAPTASVRRTLEAWLALRGYASGPLLCPVKKSGRIEVRRMSDQALYAIIVRRCLRAGVWFSPNDLRRPFARSCSIRSRAARVRQSPGPDADAGALGLHVPFRGCGPHQSVDVPSCDRKG